MARYKIVTVQDEPELLSLSDPMVHNEWPEFMLNDPIANKYWAKLFEYFPLFQFGLIEEKTDIVIAIANSIPLQLEESFDSIPDEGWDWVLEKGMKDFENNVTPNIQSALAITINSKFRGKGLSKQIIQKMKSVGATERLSHLIAPVRPNQKTLYPLADIEKYIHWKNESGSPFDAWIRVHCAVGGEIIKVCPKSMIIPGKVTEWEQWSDMRFPVSGDYVVPGALNPVSIDCDNDVGTYVEPNVLIVHTM